ncbi:hypothetical protein ABIB40_003924 [Pedobacter sp. UYP30]|uniref:hypothetical protein n=1 Tax=Pedobacter sp. UYP30 TaxID=1756400 RepID=UPI0033933EDA
MCTPRCTTLEFQNSPIYLDELESREAFYKKPIWVFNYDKFKSFRILKALPDVDHPHLADFEFCHTDHLSMIRKLLTGRGKPNILTFYHPELKALPLTSFVILFAGEIRTVCGTRRSTPLLQIWGVIFYTS